MSDPISIAVVGATGLVGRAILESSVGRTDFRLTALARRERKLPDGARMDMIVAEPANWGALLPQIRPNAMICALGTTMKAAGSQAAFRAVDHDLMMATATAAADAGVGRFVLVSSVGADPHAGSFYLQVKGQVEQALRALCRSNGSTFCNPACLLGERRGETRLAEGVGQLLGPAANLLMHGGFTRYRSVKATDVAHAALGCAMAKPAGKFTHTHTGILRAAREFTAKG